jgi:DNA-binding CsgD family transcriptional regulator
MQMEAAEPTGPRIRTFKFGEVTVTIRMGTGPGTSERPGPDTTTPLSEAVGSAISSLTPRQREVLLLAIARVDIAEIAAAMDLPPIVVDEDVVSLVGKLSERATRPETSDQPDPDTTSASAEAPRSTLLALSEREREILTLIAAGQTTEQIAETLYISRRTVNEHIARMTAKISAHARPDIPEQPTPAHDTIGYAAPRLTQREREVLDLITISKTNEQIAEALSISPQTAKIYVARVLAKFGARTRSEAAALARETGLTSRQQNKP